MREENHLNTSLDRYVSTAFAYHKILLCSLPRSSYVARDTTNGVTEAGALQQQALSPVVPEDCSRIDENQDKSLD